MNAACAKLVADMAAACIASVRDKRLFSAGRYYMNAYEAAYQLTDVDMRERATALLNGLLTVCDAAQNAVLRCSFCGVPVMPNEDQVCCDECAMLVIDGLLKSKGWNRSTSKANVDALKSKRKAVNKRVERRYSFLRRAPATPLPNPFRKEE